MANNLIGILPVQLTGDVGLKPTRVAIFTLRLKLELNVQ
jgi:hypothetical protein